VSFISDSELREVALGFLSGPVGRQDLRLAFAESRASSVDVHVEGRNFYPPMLEDIRAAKSSIHINQFGFRPGVVGDAFADALVAKATEGVPVRMVVDRQDRSPRRIRERSTSGSPPPGSRSASSGRRSRVRRSGRSDARAGHDGTWPRSATSITTRS